MRNLLSFGNVWLSITITTTLTFLSSANGIFAFSFLGNPAEINSKIPSNEVLTMRINRHEEIFGLVNIFGRLAEHNAVGFNSRYIADMESPFSLWMPSKFSRRLKVDHPYWEFIFENSNQVTREEFKCRVIKAPFKYPVSDSGRPVVPCEKLTAQYPEVSIQRLREDEGLREKVNEIFQSEEIPEELLDRVFTGFLQQRRAEMIDDVLLKDDFERLLLEWGRVGEGESDPVVDWEIFLDNLFMIELTIPNRGKAVKW